MSKKNIYKFSALSCMTLMLAAFTHCVSESPSNKSSVTNSSARKPSSDKSPNNSSGQPSELAAISVTTGVKNHEQILHTMSSLTNIPSNNAAVLAVYNDVSSTLPTTNEVKSLLAPNQVAIVKLAAEFCNQLVEGTNGARTLIFDTPGSLARIDLNTITLTNLMIVGNRQALVQRMIDSFWGGMISESDLNMAEAEFDDLLNDLAMGEAANNAGAKKVSKGVCTAILSSAHVTLL